MGGKIDWELRTFPGEEYSTHKGILLLQKCK